MSRSSYSRSHAKTNAQKNAQRNSPGTYGQYIGSQAGSQINSKISSPKNPSELIRELESNAADKIIATVHALSHEGRGIASISGKTTFIEDALPGEVVEIEYLSHRGKYDEARVISVLTASPDRVTPPCEYFGRCGGCVLQHLEPAKQVLHKESVLKDQLVHFGKITPKNNFLAPLVNPDHHGDLAYRKKARLSVRYVPKKGGALIGFREREGKYLMDMSHCEVLDPSVGQNLDKLKKLVSSLDAKLSIPQIEIAVGENRENSENKNNLITALVFRNLEILSEKDLGLLKLFGEQENFWIYLQPKGPESVYLIFPEKDLHQDQNYLSYRHIDQGVQINFSPQDFTQVNSRMNTLMLKQALDLLDLKPSDQVLDFFCGLGNFTLPMAKSAEKVLGVEGDLPMVEKARKNAEINLINNTEFIVANLFEPGWEENLEKLLPKANKVLLDPPRSGAEFLVNYIGRKSIPHIVYVSCNPATLARDAGILVNQYGYELVTAGVMDMFPHTAHVESMALFIKK